MAVFNRDDLAILTIPDTTERLDAVYTPRLPVAERYRGWFEPTRVTLANGELNPALAEDAMAKPKRTRAPRAEMPAAVRVQ